jgi:hypothetical protein
MRKQKGMSMIIMLILVPILLGIGVAYVNPIVRSFRAVVNDQKTLLAKSVADSMFEIALWESRGGGTGEVSEGCICSDGSCAIGSEKCADGVDFGFGTATGTWRVIGSPEVDSTHLINGEYTVPAPGSGDAGGDYCSTAEPVVDGTTLDAALTSLGIDTSVMDDPLDWPCHWNKLREGESAVIPMYTEQGGTVQNPSDIGLDSFELRMRTPCNPAIAPHSQVCGQTERYQIAGDEQTVPDVLTSIVQWTITAKENDENGRQLILQGLKDTMNLIKQSIFSPYSLNNYYTGSGMPLTLTENSKIVDQDSLKPFLNNYLNILYKPNLQLLVIHTLKDTSDNKIPYIEYQFKAPIDLATDSPISSTSKVVKIDVMIDGGYSESFERNIALPKPVSGFVIQQ